MTLRRFATSPWGLGLLAAAVLFANLSSPLGLHQNDEDVYMATAQAMVRGDWVVPQYMGEPSFHKPPLLYWLMAASTRALGPSALAARLPVALSGLALVLLVAHLARRISSPDAGWLAGAGVATSFALFQYGRAAMMDVPLTLMVTIAAAGCFGLARGSSASLYVLSASGAAAFLLKGPVGLILTIVPAALWWASVARVRGISLRPVHVVFAAALGFAAIGAWPLALWRRGALDEWWTLFIVVEHFGKFAGERDSAWDMVAGFGALLLPWTPLVLAAIWRAGRLRIWRDPDARIAPIFASVTLGVYSLPAVKWSQYLLPALPMLALIAAWSARDGLDRTMRAGVRATGALAAVASIAVLAASRLAPGWPDLALVAAMAVLLAVAAVALWRVRTLPLAAASLAAVLVLLAFVAPRWTLNHPPADLAASLAGHEVATYGMPPHRYTNLLGRPVESSGDVRGDLDRGVRVIIAASDFRAAAGGSVQADVGPCWPNWKRRLSFGQIWGGIVLGNREALIEDVCVVSQRPRWSPATEGIK